MRCHLWMGSAAQQAYVWGAVGANDEIGKVAAESLVQAHGQAGTDGQHLWPSGTLSLSRKSWVNERWAS